MENASGLIDAPIVCPHCHTVGNCECVGGFGAGGFDGPDYFEWLYLCGACGCRFSVVNVLNDTDD